MVEILVSIVAKVAEYLVTPIGRKFNYLCNYNDNLENLRKEVEKLADARVRVEHSVADAKRRGEEIEQDVEEWIITANKIVNEAVKFVEDEDRAKIKNQCFKGRCPNLKVRYRLSEKAAREAKAIAGLCEIGNFHKVSYLINPEKIWLTSSKGYEAFDSRMSTFKDVINALSNPSIDMIGIYGVGGVGKTMLAKEVAGQVKGDKLFDEVVFVDVSQIPNIKKMQGQIANELGLFLCEESESGGARRLYARMKKEKKILVILDDIWAKLDLETLGIPLEMSIRAVKYC